MRPSLTRIVGPPVETRAADSIALSSRDTSLSWRWLSRLAQSARPLRHILDTEKMPILSGAVTEGPMLMGLGVREIFIGAA